MPEVFFKSSANELWAEFLPNGRWVACQSNETGTNEIYVQPCPVRVSR